MPASVHLAMVPPIQNSASSGCATITSTRCDLEDAVWSSNLAGLLGPGFELVAEDLSADVHTITLTVPDGLEGTATAHVSIRITSQG
jgi:hypothetical protein